MTSASHPTAAEAIRALGARITPVRLRVLELLQGTPAMLTHQEVAARLGSEAPVDRVTLYRVLDWLVDHDLAHRTIDATRTFRYAAGAEPAGHEAHPHFRCDTCGGVYCLEAVPLWHPPLPSGFRPSQVEVNIRGECDRCAPLAGTVAR